MKASALRRITKFERFAYSNFVPVNDALKLMDAMLAFGHAKRAEEWSQEFIELVESFAEPLRSGDLKTFYARADEAKRNLAENKKWEAQM